jgi:hypothetical protein
MASTTAGWSADATAISRSPARDPGLRDGIGFDERDRGQRPLAHDHGMDELDGDVVGMRFPLR